MACCQPFDNFQGTPCSWWGFTSFIGHINNCFSFNKFSKISRRTCESRHSTLVEKHCSRATQKKIHSIFHLTITQISVKNCHLLQVSMFNCSNLLSLSMPHKSADIYKKKWMRLMVSFIFKKPFMSAHIFFLVPPELHSASKIKMNIHIGDLWRQLLKVSVVLYFFLL